jgi:hypothetical protein
MQQAYRKLTMCCVKQSHLLADSVSIVPVRMYPSAIEHCSFAASAQVNRGLVE